MDDATIRQLERRGAIVRLPTGDPGVRVALRYLRSLPDRSRAERKALLVTKLKQVADVVTHGGGILDEGSVSVSGQVCEGVLPVRGFESVKADVESQEFEVSPLFDRQVL